MGNNICDVCQLREADENNRFRFQRRLSFADCECGMTFPYYNQWKEVSLCKDCMNKIFMINRGKDIIWPDLHIKV